MRSPRSATGDDLQLFRLVQSSWETVGRIVIVAGVGYVAILLLVRMTGKRSLSKMNAFDVVINVAYGSILATMVLSDRVAVVDGLTALAVLAVLQYLLSWLSLRSKTVRTIVKAEPALLFYRGEFQQKAMQRERILEEEVRSAIREQGALALEQVEAVVLESAGKLSVVRRYDAAPTALQDVGSNST